MVLTGAGSLPSTVVIKSIHIFHHQKDAKSCPYIMEKRINEQLLRVCTINQRMVVHTFCTSSDWLLTSHKFNKPTITNIYAFLSKCTPKHQHKTYCRMNIHKHGNRYDLPTLAKNHRTLHAPPGGRIGIRTVFTTRSKSPQCDRSPWQRLFALKGPRVGWRAVFFFGDEKKCRVFFKYIMIVKQLLYLGLNY